jgi:hypothetical protein
MTALTANKAATILCAKPKSELLLPHIANILLLANWLELVALTESNEIRSVVMLMCSREVDAFAPPQKSPLGGSYPRRCNALLFRERCLQ